MPRRAEADDAARYPAVAGADAHGTGRLAFPRRATPVPWRRWRNAVGFQSRYDVHLKQFLHPAGLVVSDARRAASRATCSGAGYHAGDLRERRHAGVLGGIARAAMPLLLLCFHFDAATGRYSLAVMKVLRLAGIVTVLAIGGTVLLAVRADRRGTRA